MSSPALRRPANEPGRETAISPGGMGSVEGEGSGLTPSAPLVPSRKESRMLRGFKNFLMQGDLIVIAVGLVVALAFSTLIKAFTDSIITP
jgi:hypothetical protein